MRTSNMRPCRGGEFADISKSSWSPHAQPAAGSCRRGWPISGCKPAECAAREALEEAGLVGEVAATPLGWFSYDKRLKSGDMLACKVELFPMEVVRQRRSWPEKGARETCWCSIDEALARVPERGLRRLIAKFGEQVSNAAA